jgi:hypothetical protein
VYVLKSDYAALAKRLKEAEKHNADMKAVYEASLKRIDAQPCPLCAKRREIAQARGAKRQEKNR